MSNDTTPKHSTTAEAEQERRETLEDDLLGTLPSTSDPERVQRALIAPPASTRAHRATLVLAVVLVGAVGFLGGVWLQHFRGVGSTATALPTFPGAGALPSGAPSGFPGGGFNAASGDTASGQGTPVATGSVVLVDGKNVYVKTASGVVKAQSGPTTRITTNSPSGLVKGATVTVYGTQASDGTVTATAITTTTGTSSGSASSAGSGS